MRFLLKVVFLVGLLPLFSASSSKQTEIRKTTRDFNNESWTIIERAMEPIEMEEVKEKKPIVKKVREAILETKKSPELMIKSSKKIEESHLKREKELEPFLKDWNLVLTGSGQK